MYVKDYYSGFEGQPEIILEERDSNGVVVSRLKIWFGYFDRIIPLIPKNPNGIWEGVPYLYSIQSGWYDEDHWECDDVLNLKEQLCQIDLELLDKYSVSVLTSMIKLVEWCLNENHKLFFIYE